MQGEHLEKKRMFWKKELTFGRLVVELVISRRWISSEFALIGGSQAVGGNFSPFNDALV
jgi:hypothetical protein